MNIDFNSIDMNNSKSFINVGNPNNHKVMSDSYNTSSGITATNYSKIGSSHFDAIGNSAYKSEKKNFKDLALNAEFESMNLDAKRDYMAVMSNCISDEDFKRMQQEGFDPGKTRIEDTVTIVDRIKAAMIKGGTQVVGYTDNVSKEALADITGSEAYAEELSKQFKAKDIPLDKDIVKEIQSDYEELCQIGKLDDSAVKYIVENNLVPSIENLYTANYSSASGSVIQGQGYYASGEVSGYYSKKPEVLDMDALMPQIESIIEEAGLEPVKGNIEASKWIIEKGIPLTAESLKAFDNLEKLNMPMEYSEFVDIATNAVSDGIEIRKADLSKKQSLREEAVKIFDEVNTLGTIKGRRVLEEIRLSMTVEANLKLLRSGYAIDTAPMEDLVKTLKEIEKEFAINLTGDDNEIEAVRKKNIYDNTVDIVNSIKRAPINIVYEFEVSESLETVGERAQNLTASMEKVNASYEALMTAPRTDMGDSIRTAFRNIDDLLIDMSMSPTEENRRAVRILGYNSIEINEENVTAVKEKDRLLTDTIEKLTPGRVLNMIRANVNPLNMNISELNDYLSVQDTTKEDLLSYSSFLYKLEKSDGITEEERSAYIGIYRLVHQIEKGDYSSVGAIQESGAMFTMNNLLSTIRSKKHKNMDYRVDESFAGVDIIDKGIESITTQIARGFVTDTKDIKKVLEAAGSKEAQDEYYKEENEQIREALNVETKVLEQLVNMNTPVTAENLMDMKLMLEAPSSVFKKLRDIGVKKQPDIKLDSKEKAKDSYDSFIDDILEDIEVKAFEEPEELSVDLKSTDIRQMADLYRHLNFLKDQAREENYEIPVEIKGELTAINLKVVHKGQIPSVVISFENEIYGNVTAQFKAQDNGLSGYCSCSDREGIAYFRKNEDTLREELGKEDLILNDMNFVEAKVDLTEFNNRVTKDRNNDTDVVSTEKLYKAAKVFLNFVSE